MIILLSPTKTLSNTLIKGEVSPYFSELTNNLVNIVKSYSVSEITTNFKVSEKIALEVYSYYRDFNASFMAAYLYSGTSFKYLDPKTINKDDLSRLYILSALYGINNGLSNISKYRLDIKDKIRGVNLYDYWRYPINNFLKMFDNEIIINLASLEYYKLVDISKKNIITINFSSNKKISSMELKKLRGLFARKLLINNYKDVNHIKTLVIENYKFSSNLSSTNNYIFERNL